ncbi:DUF6600 domain-containing protein [Pendulispora albinea]|uniref:Lipoprotein n=1 Tax=Pendulispora albinea TaxID=2741071 RepID=A0ABZ2M8X7_9BACT
MKMQRLVLMSAAGLSLAGALGCASTLPDIESPVGEVHHSVGYVPSETDIFAEQYSDTDPSALDQFRTELEPHGSWVDDPRLGTVWYPSRDEVGPEFTPYATHGRWTYGQREYVWVSTLPWGWVTFHYGRWMYSGARGWAWVPGRRYAGAWVIWRTGSSGYVGWGAAPANWYWQNEVPVRTPKPTTLGFVYCRTSDLFAASVASKLIGLPDVVNVATGTRPYNWQEHSPSMVPTTASPPPTELGIAEADVALTPANDASLQRAWLIARPGGARAAGVRPLLGTDPPRLKEWVAGRPRYIQPVAGNTNDAK